MMDSPTLSEVLHRIKACTPVGSPLVEFDLMKILTTKEGRVFIDLETIINTLYRLHDTAKDAEPKA